MHWLTAHRFTLGIILGLAFGAAGSYAVFAQQQTLALPIPPLREETTNYRLIDPLLACNSREATTGRYKELEDALHGVITADKQAGSAKEISVYFQEYPSGRWVGIDQDHQYDPASLLKIVLMIAYLKDDELNPGSIEKKYFYTPTLQQLNNSIPFDATSTLTVGQEYSAEALIRAMIVDSDNGAKDVLLDNANNKTLSQVYKDLNIPDPDSTSGPYTISPKAYSLFFRILYNSTYLSRMNSEKAMGFLSKAIYKNGIVSGLPEGVTVAHKFGEHVTSNTDGSVQSVELHDCGVVYGPNLPYFLCVMTSGSDISGLKSAIKDVSKTVFDSLDTVQVKK